MEEGSKKLEISFEFACFFEADISYIDIFDLLALHLSAVCFVNIPNY